MAELSAKELDLLQRLEAKPELRRYFFKKAKGLKWLGPLKERGYFDAANHLGPQPSNEEGYVTIPHWPVTDYLLSIAPDLGMAEHAEEAMEVLNIIWGVSQDAADRALSNYRTWWQFAQIIPRIPVHLIEPERLAKYVAYWLEDPFDRGLLAEQLGTKWLPELLLSEERNARDISVSLLQHLYHVHVHQRGEEGREPEVRLAAEKWHLDNVTKAVAKKSGAVLGIQACEVFADALDQSMQVTSRDSYSYIWRPAVEENPQNSSRDALDVLIVALRECINGMLSVGNKDAESYVSFLLDTPSNMLRRIAVHAVAEHYDSLSELAEKALAPKNFVANLRHEVWHLLERRFDQMQQGLQGFVVDHISSITINDDDDNEDLKYSNFVRACWLAAIRNKSPDLQRQYDEAVSVAGAEPDHPDFVSYQSGGLVERESPMPREELLALSIDQLVDYLDNYEDPNDFLGPGIEGLVGTLKEAIKSEPLKYSPQLHRFAELDLCYVHSVIEGFAEVWKNKVALPWSDVWERLFSFSAKVIGRSDFWEPENAEQGANFVANRHWVVASIGRLVESGVRSDEWAFDPALLPEALGLLTSLLEKQEGVDFDEGSDAVFRTINSPRGQCLEALVLLALRECRLTGEGGQEHEDVWLRLEPYFTNEFQRGFGYEYPTLVAMYLPSFLYLSKGWTLGHLDTLFSVEDRLHWLCAMQGYARIRRVYEPIYEYLRDRGHLLRALDESALRGEVCTKVIQHIVIAYLRDLEDIDDEHSMLAVLLSRSEPEEIDQIIWFVWTLRDGGDEALVPRIMCLWERIASGVNLESKAGQRLASRLSKWIAFLSSIDDGNRSLATAAIRYAEVDHNGYQMLQELSRLSKTQPQEAALLWESMLKHSAPDYPSDAIQEIFSSLVDLGTDGVRIAREIASTYLRQGTSRPHEWLSEMLDRSQ